MCFIFIFIYLYFTISLGANKKTTVYTGSINCNMNVSTQSIIDGWNSESYITKLLLCFKRSSSKCDSIISPNSIQIDTVALEET